MAGAFHGVSEADAVVSVGVSGPGVVKYALGPNPTPFPILGKGGGSGGYTPAACRRKRIARTGGQGLAAENGGAMHP